MKYGISARGRSELEKHLKGKRLSARQAGKAKCYDCARCPINQFLCAGEACRSVYSDIDSLVDGQLPPTKVGNLQLPIEK